MATNGLNLQTSGLTFATGTVDRMIIDASGQFGFGTITPSTDFHVDAAGVRFEGIPSSSSNTNFMVTDGNGVVGTRSDIAVGTVVTDVTEASNVVTVAYNDIADTTFTIDALTSVAYDTSWGIAQSGTGTVSDGNEKENTDANSVSNLASGNFFASLKNMPSHPERRARQAVLLAQKVLETEKQRDSMTVEVIELKKQLESSKNDTKAAEQALQRSNQPTVYLVTKLRDEEAQLAATRAKLKAQEDVVARIMEQKKTLVADNEAIRERMRLMLHQRGEVDQLRGLLETLQTTDIDATTSPGNTSPRVTVNDKSADDVIILDEPSDDGIDIPVSPRTINRPTPIDTGYAASAQSQSPTPTAAHSHSSHGHSSRGKAPSPEQLSRMVTSPKSAAGSSPSSKSKWHTREELPNKSF